MAALTNRGIPLSLINPEYLHSNATSHNWSFGAIAELIDNAYDPDVSAKQLWIDKTVIKDQDCLIFMDNGNGMNYDKLHKMLSFGFSDKPTAKGHVPIGRYGNGFKSGSIRLGKNAIVFTKKYDTICVGFLSQTYLKKIEAQNVIVPIVKFTNTEQTVRAAPEHAESLHDILTYSLFNTKEELLSEFRALDGVCTNSSGTRIIIWNLQRGSSGELEFDFKKDPHDIRILDEEYSRFREKNKRQTVDAMAVPEIKYSLREYCSILYLKPRMEIILRGEKVESQPFTKTLGRSKDYTYKPDGSKEKITITFGYNKKSKEYYGLMMFHKNRLIKAYKPVAFQRKGNQRGQGVIGVIECNYLTPTHNKQDFYDTQEYRNTLKNMNMKLEHYWLNNRYSYQGLNTNVDSKSTDEEELKNSDDDHLDYQTTYKKQSTDEEELKNSDDDHLDYQTTYKKQSTDEEELKNSDDDHLDYQTTYKKHEQNQKLQQKNKQQSSSTIRPYDDTLSVILNSSSSTTPTRKNKALDMSQERPKKKSKKMSSDKNKPDLLGMSSHFSDTNTADCKDFKTPLKNDSKDVMDPSIMKKEETIEITKDRSEDQQKYKVLYLQVMEAVRQVQDKCIEVKKGLKTEKVDTKMDSLEYEQMLSNYLQKYLEEIKNENVEEHVEDCDSQLLWNYETQGRSESGSGHRENKTQSLLKEFTQRIAHLLVPSLKLEQIIDEFVTQVTNEISPKEAVGLTREAEFHASCSTFKEDNWAISTPDSHTKYDSAVTNVIIPEIVQHCADSGEYRFLCSHAGLFHCKLTNLVFEMKGKGYVSYTVVFWKDIQMHSMGQLKPAGPLYNINCSEDSILNLHLPHCEIHIDNQIKLAVAHFSEDNVEIIDPLNITSTHVILKVKRLSAFGLLKKWIFPERAISAQVLLFYKEMIRKKKTLYIHLLPGNVPIEEVRRKHMFNTYIQCSSLCQLIPGKKYRPLCEPYVSQPKDGTFLCFNDPNYHSTFDLNLNTEDKELTLGLLDENGQEVWEPRQVCLTANSREAVPVEMDKGADFVDNHRDTLIQRVLSVVEIADTLLTKRKINREKYSDIIGATTQQDKMRILYSCLDSGGRAVKKEFYKILKEKQPAIVNDLV